MKVRNGFVSNSSSSSFIVKIDGDFFDKELKRTNMIVNELSIPLLEEYGFRKTTTNSPFSWKVIEAKHDDPIDGTYMHYSVSCNEDEVLAFLMKNNIPFRASCHYDQYYIMMKKDAYLYIYASNFGNEIDMYGAEDDVDFWKNINRNPKVEERSVKLFLEENK
jgi:hypothetical protein